MARRFPPQRECYGMPSRARTAFEPMQAIRQVGEDPRAGLAREEMLGVAYPTCRDGIAHRRSSYSPLLRRSKAARLVRQARSMPPRASQPEWTTARSAELCIHHPPVDERRHLFREPSIRLITPVRKPYSPFASEPRHRDCKPATAAQALASELRACPSYRSEFADLITALHDAGCSWGLNPPVSSRD
jgi:hypothetical protein